MSAHISIDVGFLEANLSDEWVMKMQGIYLSVA